MLRILFILTSIFTLLLSDILSLTTPIIQKARIKTFDSSKEIHVNINSKILIKNQTISINLPENITVYFENSNFISRKSGDYTWQGKSINGTGDDFLLLTTKNGKTYGIIVHNKIKYILQNSSDGNYKIFKKQIQPKNHDDFIQLPPIKTNYFDKDIKSRSSSKLRISQKLRTTSSTIDVLVLYTQAYANYYGGGLSAKIQNSIDYANTAMNNSDILMIYHLAHQVLFENSDSNESVGISNALERISAIDTSNGEAQNINVNADVRRLRADYHADLVTLFRLNISGGTVGLGWIASNNSKLAMRYTSFNVSEFDDITFAHESGHNLGCGHSRDIDNCAGAIFNYACGFDDGTTGTIMSYNQSPITYFSTPDKTYDGTVIGASDTDCSRAINETRVSMQNVSNINEQNEDEDTYSNNVITGHLDSGTDRDQYQIGLGGSTTIEMSSQYSNIAYYLNLYDKNGYLINSYMSGSETITLDNGMYNLIISNHNDATGSYYNDTKNYTVNITSNYIKPTENITSIITYLLF